MTFLWTVFAIDNFRCVVTGSDFHVFRAYLCPVISEPNTRPSTIGAVKPVAVDEEAATSMPTDGSSGLGRRRSPSSACRSPNQRSDVMLSYLAA